ncbi:MAG: SDR family oxidoreductase [Campylobacterales bacterium]|nr:SDR family oxidoreductase [Campylobacterales bacterium]
MKHTQTIIKHFTNAMSTQITRLENVHRRVGDDWLPWFDPNDIMLYEGMIEWLNTLERETPKEEYLSTKPYRFMMELIPEYVNANIEQLCDEELNEITLFWNEYSKHKNSMSSTKIDSQKKNIIITGASNGIGRAIAAKLSQNYRIITIDKIESEDKNIAFYKCNLSNRKALLETIKQIKEEYNSLFALINNAGFGLFKPLDEQSLEEWDSVLATNLNAPYILSKAFAPLLSQSNGHIINISSTRALMSEAGTESYSASKGGLSALTHALAISLAHSVKVNSISPGWINTDTNFTPSSEDNAQHPCGRVGTPQDIVEVVEFLLSSSGFITGSDFVIDGGMTKKMIYSY